RINRWTLIQQIDHEHWLCRCQCGTEKAVEKWTLAYENSKSCGCLHREIVAKQATKHRMSRTRTYSCYYNMIRRCRSDRRYRKHCIIVCTRWQESFQNFLADMGPCPSPQHSLDRYPDNNGNYEPGNVRWATLQEQANNTRRNHIVEWN